MFKTVDKAPSTSLELLDVPLVRRRTQGYSATSMCSLHFACDHMGRGLSPFRVSGAFSLV